MDPLCRHASKWQNIFGCRGVGNQKKPGSPLLKCVKFFAFVTVLIINRSNTALLMSNAQLGNMGRYTKGSQSGTHGAAQVV